MRDTDGEWKCVNLCYIEPRRDTFAANEILNLALGSAVYDPGTVSQDLIDLVNNIYSLYQSCYTKYVQNGDFGVFSGLWDSEVIESAWNNFYAYTPQNYAEQIYKSEAEEKLNEIKEEFSNEATIAAGGYAAQYLDDVMGDLLSGIF